MKTRTPKISQREARRLRKEVMRLNAVLSKQQNDWSEDWPGGTHICTIFQLPELVMASIRTARRLNHAVVVVDVRDEVNVYALPISSCAVK